MSAARLVSMGRYRRRDATGVRSDLSKSHGVAQVRQKSGRGAGRAARAGTRENLGTMAPWGGGDYAEGSYGERTPALARLDKSGRIARSSGPGGSVYTGRPNDKLAE